MTSPTSINFIESSSGSHYNPLRISPIPRGNMLPVEILTQIFSLVCNAQLHVCPAEFDVGYRHRDSRPFLKAPVILSHVCSRWRHVAINSSSLWSHIDLYPDQCSRPILSSRLDAYSTRAVPALLEIHIVIPSHEFLNKARIPTSTDGTIFPFLIAVAPRIRSLVYKSPFKTHYSPFCNTVLATCLANCIPGTLSEVSIEEYAYADFDMDDLVTRAQTQDGQVTQSTIESAWLPVKTLKFNDCRIDWKSKAYHGLTEFRLIYGPVGEAGLISVLQSSPQIRVLELEFELKNYNSEQMQSRPVALNNLEVLVLRLSPEDLSSVLWYITPGSIPLSLSLQHPWDHVYEFPGLTELESFVARSNIHRFNAIKFKACFELTEFLSMIPTIRVLAVDRFKHTFKKESSTPSDFTLDALYVLHSKYGTVFPWPSLERFVKKHNVQKLTLWKYNFEASGPGEIGYKTIPDNLYTICPVVKVVPDSEPNPIAEWY